MSEGTTRDQEDRFAFGENWRSFLSTLDDERIRMAEESLLDMLAAEDLSGERFLDIGSGSGLFSLAARRLGARVRSFDYDAQSVACTRELKRRYFPDDEGWQIEQGSVLDRAYMSGLGGYDIVYSWGVLHHTGAMWLAIERAIGAVSPSGGKLYIAIYNDQGWKSHAWWFVKLTYNRLPKILRPLFVVVMTWLTRILVLLKYTLKLRPMIAIRSLFRERRSRGMSNRHDMTDWMGGFPYEFSSLETLSEYFRSRGFRIIKARASTTLGCHELSMIRETPEPQ